MKKAWMKVERSVLAGSVFVATLISAAMAEAKTARDLMERFRYEVLEPFRDFFLYGCGLVGLVFIGMGCFRLYKRSQQGMQQQISVGEIVTLFLVGASLLVLAFIAATMVESVTGETATSLDRF